MRILNNLIVRGNSDYRSDIDGLRAVACLAVVLFHAFPTSLKGGFVGVDIFFVISGYLISSILYRNLFNPNVPGKVNIVDFYIRRIRRIFPSLLAVLSTMLVLGWFILLPDEYSLLGKHTFGGATYINNFMLYKETGSYFDVNSNTKPLLHLWSLGVEEQFYLIFPVFLWLIYKSNLNFVLSLTVFTVISFILNKNAINHNHQSAAFYLPWYRFWEFSIGAILAYLINFHKDVLAKAKAFIVNNLPSLLFRNSNKNINDTDINNAISVFGLLVILFGIFTVENNYKFPGSKALIPVIGALMIIGAGKEAFINKHILSNKVIVFLGLISYPLYLWHWPLLSLAYICEGELPEVWIRWCAVGIALVLATFTFIVIEPPLRYGLYSKSKAVGLMMFLVCVGGVGLYVYEGNGMPKRFKTIEAESTLLSEIEELNTIKYQNCLKYYPEWKEQDHKCYMEKIPSSVSIFGDSHADHLLTGLTKYSVEHNLKFNLYPSSGQIPLYGLMSLTQTSNAEFNKMREKGHDLITRSFNDQINNPNSKLFVFAHNPACSYYDTLDTIEPQNNNLNITQKYRIGLERTISMLTKADKKLLFVLDNPVLPFLPQKCNKARPLYLTEKKCKFDRSIYDQQEATNTYNSIIKEYAKKYSNIEYIDLSELFCDKQNCYLTDKEGKIMYKDKDHLNSTGSLYVAQYIIQIIIEMLK